MIAEHSFLDTILRPIQRDDAGDLERLEDAIVQIALNLGQCGDHFAISDAEPDPPSWHIVTLGESVKLDADLLCLRNLQETRGAVAVEAQVSIGEVMDHDDVVLLGECHDLFKKLQVHNRGGRIMRKVDDQDPGTRKCLAIDPHQVFEEITLGAQCNSTHLSPRNDHAIHVNGIGRRGRQHHIAGTHHGQREMRNSFLRPDGDNRLSLRVQVHIVAALVAAGNRMTEFGDPPRCRVAMVLAISDSFDELIDDMAWGRLIRIPHAKINDIFASVSGLQLEGLDLGKHVRWEPFYSVKPFHCFPTLHPTWPV